MVSYKLKSKVEDFLVNEVSLWPDLCPREFSQFTYIRVKKVGMTTFEALDKIRQFFRLGYSDVSKQGLKDEDAITYQLIAVKSILLAEDISRFNRKFAVSCPLLKIVDLFGYGKEPLKSRLLHGNVFKVTIRNLDKSAVNLLYNFCFKNRFFTFINYYDSQRFGVAGGHYNTHLIGKAIVENDWLKALVEFKNSTNFKKPKLGVVDNLNLSKENCKSFFRKLDPEKVVFFINSYTSYLWNQEVNDFLKKMENATEYEFPELGKLALLKGNTFALPNVFPANGYVLDKKEFKIFKEIKVRNLTTTTMIFFRGTGRDEINPDKCKVSVSFFLPSGCYATMLIKQFFLGLSNQLKRE